MFRTLLLLQIVAHAACTTTVGPASGFTEKEFAHLGFLQGRWHGVAPDGSPFFEEYHWIDARTLQSRRYADASFSKITDSSTVTLENGEILSAWGDFSWRANKLDARTACFEPLQAPSSFCWEWVEPSRVEVTQRWTDEAGKAQSYVVPLTRVAS